MPISQYRSLDGLVLHVDSVDAQDVVAEVKRLKATLLAQQDYERTSRPVEALAKQLSAPHHHKPSYFANA